MKKLFPVAIVLLCVALFTACDKVDENPYGNWKCTCFVTTTDTFLHLTFKDTVVLNVNDMDKNSAKTYCTKAKNGYTDTLGHSAECSLK